ncbi:hypothetical protein, partial [Legionella maceachernii]|uniref:hypothetical protein n=1 Tax=Legionella maceachernii TaxID=466 RepID=UPI001A94172C
SNGCRGQAAARRRQVNCQQTLVISLTTLKTHTFFTECSATQVNRLAKTIYSPEHCLLYS